MSNKSKTGAYNLKRGQNNRLSEDRSKRNSRDNFKNKRVVVQEKEFNGYTIPLIFVIAIIPLIVRMYYYKSYVSEYPWGINNDYNYDFFLFYKQWALVAASAIMIIMIAYKVYKERYKIKISPVLYPLGLYALLSLLSAIFTVNLRYSLQGSTDQFESVFALISYCVIVLYAYLFAKSEYDFEVVLKCLLISVLIMSAIGISQFAGKDFYATEIGEKLITGGILPKENKLDFVMGEGRVYTSLYNPNYVGVYVSMVLPLFLVLLLFSKKIFKSLLYLTAITGLMICLFGSESLAGFVGIAVGVIGIIVVMWRYLIKRYYITLPVFLLLIAALFILNKQTDNYMLNRVRQAFNIKKAEEPALSQIITGDDKVSIVYNKSKLDISMILTGSEGLEFALTDEEGNNVLYVYDTASGEFVIKDERFPFRLMYMGQDQYLSFYVNIGGKKWVFTNQLGDGTYYYYNYVNKWSKIVTPPAVVKGYESFASGRGYIWSRTLPLIKKHILLGSGPDTFLLEFPQQDYVGLYNHGFNNMIMTKPHSLYLQIAVNTGLISLIAFVAFYAMYFFSSLSLYIRGRFNNYYARVGVAIMIGTAVYMVTGLTNDSSITTAPVFWCLMGLGMAANAKAKPLIKKEAEEAKARKLQKKMEKRMKKQAPAVQ